MRTWCGSITSRLDDGKFVNLALDCEGFNLGMEDHSLICVQLGEIYDDTYDVFGWGDDACPAVDPRPGVIVSTPFTQEMKDLLTQVLNHPSITLITFDFTADIGTLLEEGVLVNLQRIVDCQMQTLKAKQGSILADTKNKGLVFFLREGFESELEDPLFAKCGPYINQKLNLEWNAIIFTIIHDNLPKDKFMSKKLLEYAARDIPFTGLACTVMIDLNRRELVLQNTRKKINEFQEVSAIDHTPLAGAILRNCAFMSDRYREPPTELSDDFDLKKALRLWVNLRGRIFGERTVGHRLTSIAEGVFQRNIEQVERLLVEHIEGIRKLADLPE
jgi:uncharacterized protein (DUF3820 family)